MTKYWALSWKRWQTIMSKRENAFFFFVFFCFKLKSTIPQGHKSIDMVFESLTHRLWKA